MGASISLKRPVALRADQDFAGALRLSGEMFPSDRGPPMQFAPMRERARRRFLTGHRRHCAIFDRFFHQAKSTEANLPRRLPEALMLSVFSLLPLLLKRREVRAPFVAIGAVGLLTTHCGHSALLQNTFYGG